MAQPSNSQGPQPVQGQVVSFPSGSRNVPYATRGGLRKIDPDAIEVRRSGPLGLFENAEDAAHREAIIKGCHLADEAIQMEGNSIRAEVTGVANTIEGADALLSMVDTTQPNTTLGRLAEDMAGRSITNLREGHYSRMADLDGEARNLFRSRRR